VCTKEILVESEKYDCHLHLLITF